MCAETRSFKEVGDPIYSAQEQNEPLIWKVRDLAQNRGRARGPQGPDSHSPDAQGPDSHSPDAQGPHSHKGPSPLEGWNNHYKSATEQYDRLAEPDKRNVDELADAIIKEDQQRIGEIVRRYGDNPAGLAGLINPLQARLYDTLIERNGGDRNRSLDDLGYSISAGISSSETNVAIRFPDGPYGYFSTKK
jgi:hypothetical protein